MIIRFILVTRKPEKSYLVYKNSAVLVSVLVCQQVDLQGCGGCSLAIVGAGWTTVVPGVDSSEEIVVGLHLDTHHSGPAGGADTRTEHGVHPLSSCLLSLHTVRQIVRTSHAGQQQHLEKIGVNSVEGKNKILFRSFGSFIPLTID